MIDLETLGTKPGIVIASVAAIEFDIQTGVIGRQFYEQINIQSCLDAGLKVDGSTLLWWLQQPENARVEIYNAPKYIVDGKNYVGKPLKLVLTSFNQFFSNVHREASAIQVWGNGSSFDLGILAAGYDACNKPVPWMFWNERDVRTLVELNPSIKKNTVFEGVQHHPLHDCLHQIKYCVATWNSAIHRYHDGTNDAVSHS